MVQYGLLAKIAISCRPNPPRQLSQDVQRPVGRMAEGSLDWIFTEYFGCPGLTSVGIRRMLPGLFRRAWPMAVARVLGDIPGGAMEGDR